MGSQMQLEPEQTPMDSKELHRSEHFRQSSQTSTATTHHSESTSTSGSSGSLREEIVAEGCTRRLLVAVTNDMVGDDFLNSLREQQEALGFHFTGTLGEMLQQRGVRNAMLADELRDKFAFLDILPGHDFPVVNKILRHGCATKLPGAPFPDVDLEPAQRLRYASTGLGPNYNLRSSGSMHDQYLQLLNRSAAPSDGSGVVIAVIDSGFEKTGVLSGFLDLVEPTNTTEKDNFGHGTAMASIIQDMAAGATVFAVRMADQEPDVSEAMLGICTGSFHYAADIINLSFGLPEGTTCPHCGAQAAVSKVFQRFLHCLSEKPMSAYGPPILVAATGNDGHATGFDSPARWDFTLAVGSITQARNRSTFSNYGTRYHSQYIMMPGGEEQQGTISEWVGEARHKCYGTSASAAYASGVLALYLSDNTYRTADRAAFLQDVLKRCQPCNNHQALEHGLGYLPYYP
jgi:hypothetical protein